jgi:uncharacterized cupin superfamily protein
MEHGAFPAGEGWFVLNAQDARWFDCGDSGFYTSFEGESVRFEHVGIGLNVLEPCQPMAMYHGEDAQEDFLVLSGECLLIVEGEERTLRAWDLVHCPPWTEHVIVGAGTWPSVVLGVGARRPGRGLVFPVNETARRHGVGVEKETADPREAYAGFPPPQPAACPQTFPAE